MNRNVLSAIAAISCLSLVLCAIVSCGKQEGAGNGFDKALIERYGGDWNGCVQFLDGTGKYENLTGIVAAIARLNIAEDGGIAPFIGLDVEDTPIEGLSAKFDGEEILLCGKWISADFQDVRMTESGGTLSTRISVSKEAGSVSLAFNFRRLDDTGWTDEKPGFSESQINACMGKSFDELAEMIGYGKSDYPAPSGEANPPEAGEDNGNGAQAGSVVGSWVYVNGGYTYTFNADGTGSYEAGSTVMEFTYEDTGSTLSILFKGNTMASEYAYTINGNTLSIEDSFGDTVQYTKK